MTLVVQPRHLATVEPVKAALAAILEASLQDALDYVEDRAEAAGLAAVVLPFPKDIRLVTARDYTAINAYPTITIETAGLGQKLANQQPVSGQMTGTIRVIVWLQAGVADEMDAMLDRYGAAIVLLLKQDDALAGCSLGDELPSVEPDDTGGTANRRRVGVMFSVDMRV